MTSTFFPENVDKLVDGVDNFFDFQGVDDPKPVHKKKTRTPKNRANEIFLNSFWA
jgi:hypothetical protein